MNIRELVAALGGRLEVAAEVDVHHSAVSHWMAADMVPAARVAALWKMARHQKVDWTPSGFESIAAELVPPEDGASREGA